MLKDDFETLEYQYNINPEERTEVEALNQLDVIDRNIFIMYIECDGQYSKLAKKLHLSVPFIKERINAIREQLKNNIINIKENE